MKKKYEVTEDSIVFNGHTLYRIRALRSIGGIQAGYWGGYVESEDNLSHEGLCWVRGYAMVFENARVYDDAWLSDGAKAYGNAQVFGTASLYEHAQVYEDASVYGRSYISGITQICGTACVVGVKTIYIYGDTKIDHGIWTQFVKLDDKQYLLSSTLEKLRL